MPIKKVISLKSSFNSQLNFTSHLKLLLPLSQSHISIPPLSNECERVLILHNNTTTLVRSTNLSIYTADQEHCSTKSNNSSSPFIQQHLRLIPSTTHFSTILIHIYTYRYIIGGSHLPQKCPHSIRQESHQNQIYSVITVCGLVIVLLLLLWLGVVVVAQFTCEYDVHIYIYLW